MKNDFEAMTKTFLTPQNCITGFIIKRTRFEVAGFLTLLFVLIVTSMQAQKKDWGGEGELEDVEIEIVKERQITLPKANRNFEKVPPRPSEPARNPITYDFRAITFETAPITPVIRPLKLKQEGQSRLFKNYVSVGYGNYATPYIDAFFNSGRDRNKMWGAHAYLNNSIKGPVDGRNSGSGTYGVSLYGQSFSNLFSVAGDVGFENRSTHFYGYVPGTDVDPSDIRQAINLFKMGLSIANAKNSAFSYKLGGKFSYLGDKYSARESEVDLDLNSYYKIDDDNRIRINAAYYLISRKDKNVDPKPRNLFQVNAAYEFVAMEDLKVSAGAVVAYENDTINNKDLHIYPDFKATYKISPAVDAFGSLTGGVEKVSLQSLTNENLWLAPDVAIYHTNKLFDFQAGINAKLGNKVSASTGFSLASLKNWYYYINDATDQAKFLVKYNNNSVQRTNLFASISYTQVSAKFMLRGDLFNYSSEQILHRPTYKVTANASYNLYQKMLFKVDLIAQGGMKAQDPIPLKMITLDPAFDLNFRAEYLFSQSLSFFAQFNNITGNNYPVFFHYPVRGFQVLGGVTWAF